MFQSLIGRLQTAFVEFGTSKMAAFQSLIGRLQTVDVGVHVGVGVGGFNPS